MSKKSRMPWGKTTTVAVIGFVLLFFYFTSQEAKAQTSVEFSVTPALVGGDRYDSESLYFVESFNNRKYQVGLLLLSGLHCDGEHSCKRGESGNNQAFFVQRVVYYDNFYLGLGISRWHNETPAWNSTTPYSLSIGYDFSEDVGLVWRHFSTGGSSTNNGGLDLVGFVWRF